MSFQTFKYKKILYENGKTELVIKSYPEHYVV